MKRREVFCWGLQGAIKWPKRLKVGDEFEVMYVNSVRPRIEALVRNFLERSAARAEVEWDVERGRCNVRITAKFEKITDLAWDTEVRSVI